MIRFLSLLPFNSDFEVCPQSRDKTQVRVLCFWPRAMRLGVWVSCWSLP